MKPYLLIAISGLILCAAAGGGPQAAHLPKQARFSRLNQRMRLECGVGFRQLRTCRRTRPGQLCAISRRETDRCCTSVLGRNDIQEVRQHDFRRKAKWSFADPDGSHPLIKPFR